MKTQSMQHLTHIFISDNIEIYRKVYKDGQQAPHLAVGSYIRFKREPYDSNKENYSTYLDRQAAIRLQSQETQLGGFIPFAITPPMIICKCIIEEIQCDLDKNIVFFYVNIEDEFLKEKFKEMDK